MESYARTENNLYDWIISNEVQDIQTTILIDAKPSDTTLPNTITTKAEDLLKNLKGRIFPIALRGKSQGGKSTTINRIAQMTNISIDSQLPVAENLGSTTTHGIWLMIITFKNNDALLLFDVQGTDRGADEVTYKLIAFTDHICTKVVDVFRMPFQGFSNDYIDALYCLAMGRESVENLHPTSDKIILWTDCRLPKDSPLNKRKCEKAAEYHGAILSDVVGDHSMIAKKASEYTKHTKILSMSKPEDGIIENVSKLDNNHPFVQENILPVVQTILSNVQSAKIHACEIRGVNDYVQYLKIIYESIKYSNVIFPWSQTTLISNIVLSESEKQKKWIDKQLQEIKQEYSQNFDWIENNSHAFIESKKNECIKRFKDALDSLPNDSWIKLDEDFTFYVNHQSEQLIIHLKGILLPAIIERNYTELNELCKMGYASNTLINKLNKKKTEMIEQMKIIPVFNNNMSELEERLTRESFDMRVTELFSIQKTIEHEWGSRRADFQRKIHPPDQNEIDHEIDKLIEDYSKYASKQFQSFNIIPQAFFNIENQKQAIRKNNDQQANKMMEKKQSECVLKFSLRIHEVLSMGNTTEQEKYRLLLEKSAECKLEYYSKVEHPWNDLSFEKVAAKLEAMLNDALNKIYTPEVQEKLTRQRMNQMKKFAKFHTTDNENEAWIHCLKCQRIFAGRTEGCKKVTCDYSFVVKDSKQVNLEQKKEFVCGFEFQWKKAKPVDFNKLPSDFWLSSVERRGRRGVICKAVNTHGSAARSASSAALTRVTQSSTARPKKTRRSRSIVS